MDVMGPQRVLVAGSGGGEVLVLDEPLSLWGGIDVATGRIIDAHHPQCGEIITNKVMVLPYARGSSSTANTLAEAIHRATGPAAIVLAEPDEILVLGAVVAGELYGEWCPVIALNRDDYEQLATGQQLDIRPDGIV